MSADDARLRRLAPFVKWRLWRYTDDLEAHAVGEEIEDRVRAGESLPMAVKEEMGRFLAGQERDGSCLFDARRAASALRLDVGSAVTSRLQHASASEGFDLDVVVCIVGAPRSGTSTLLDRLTHVTSWAVVTDNSHHLWSRWGLQRAECRFLRRQPPSVLQRDTREARLDLRVSWPSEAENIFHRCAPCYTHIGGHRYQLRDNVVVKDSDRLQRVVSDHLGWFRSPILLLKSPFNVMRVPALRKALGGRWLIVHARRDPGAVAESMARNGFGYQADGRTLSPLEATVWFSHRAEELADITVSHADLVADSCGQVRRIVDLVGSR